jgi:hypothetical protein
MGRREGLLQSDNPAVDLLPLSRPWKGWTYTITKENGAASRPLDDFRIGRWILM